MTTQAYIGKGSIYIAKAGDPLIRIGNTSKLEFAIEEDKKEQMDYENPGGGVADSVTRIKSVKLSLSVHKLSAENLALALRGASAAVTGGAVVDEAHANVQVGGLVVFNKTPDISVAYVVTDNAGTTTYTVGADYIVRRAGLEIPAGSTIADASTIKVDYTALAAMKVEALTAVGEELRLVFDGVNEANGKAMLVEAFRVKPGAAKGWSLIGDDFATLEIEADVLKDETITTTGLSQYFKARMAS
jgi:hypothetical protein